MLSPLFTGDWLLSEFDVQLLAIAPLVEGPVTPKPVVSGEPLETTLLAFCHA